MAVIIDWNNKIILDCSNGIISGLYDSILKLIYEQNLLFNNEISKLIDRLESASRGIGFDLSEYINTKENLEIFTKLVRNGINKLYYDIPGLPQTTIDRLENFYNELIEIGKSYDIQSKK